VPCQQRVNKALNVGGQHVRHIGREPHLKTVVGDMKGHVLEGAVVTMRGCIHQGRSVRATVAGNRGGANEGSGRAIGKQRRHDHVLQRIVPLHVQGTQLHRQHQGQPARAGAHGLARALERWKGAVTAHAQDAGAAQGSRHA
jgi:hypothetical protein